MLAVHLRAWSRPTGLLTFGFLCCSVSCAAQQLHHLIEQVSTVRDNLTVEDKQSSDAEFGDRAESKKLVEASGSSAIVLQLACECASRRLLTVVLTASRRSFVRLACLRTRTGARAAKERPDLGPDRRLVPRHPKGLYSFGSACLATTRFGRCLLTDVDGVCCDGGRPVCWRRQSAC